MAQGTQPASRRQEDPQTAAIRTAAGELVKAFNAGKAEDVVALFHADGELIDEEGTIYQGHAEIKELLSTFYTRFPGTKLEINIESIRLVGPIAFEEGTRTMTATDGATQSRFRYIAVRTKGDAGWKIASIRDFAEDPVPTANDYLQPLAWLVGDWINEGTDGKVAISFRWSDDKNYVLGEFQMNSPALKDADSSLRIGWDPSRGTLRSWLFDADGGFAEGTWTVVEDGIVVKSSTVNPDGSTASATMTFTPVDKDHFTISGTERIVAGSREPDFELTIARRPPAVGN
jgi:uncharacterized protein (TIGR02246 family)